MRKAISLVALMALVPVAHADMAKKGDYSINAEYRARYLYQDNQTGDKNATPTSSNTTDQRIKLDLSFRPSEKFTFNATLLNNATWGNDVVTANSGDAMNDGIGDSQNAVLVQQAYATWMVSNDFQLKAGRSTFELGDGSVFATNDYEKTPYAFEGVLGTYEFEFGRVKAWIYQVAKYTKTDAATLESDAGAEMYGLYYEMKTTPEWMKTANIYVLQDNKSQTATPATDGKDIFRYGITLGGDVQMFDWKVDYDGMSGHYKNATANKKADGNMWQVEVGAKFENFMKSRLFVVYHQDSGTKASTTDKNSTYDAMYYDMHRNAGLMDIVGWGNLTDMAIGYNVNPTDQTMAGIQYHIFQKTEKEGAATAGVYGASLFNDATANESDLGSEIDLCAGHKYDGGFSIMARLGYFMPGKALKNATAKRSDSITQAMLQGKLVF